MTPRLVPWAIYDGGGRLAYLAMSATAADVWGIFLDYLTLTNDNDRDSALSRYRNDGWVCVRVSVKRL